VCGAAVRSGTRQSWSGSGILDGGQAVALRRVLWGACCGAAAGRVRPPAAWARQLAPARKVVHLRTGQPTEVIHRCGDPVRRIASMPENRQPGRSDPARHRELHACKLLTMWITTVENFRILACEFRRGGPDSVCTGRGPQREGPAGERPRNTAGETAGNSEGHQAAICGLDRLQDRTRRRRRPSVRRTRRSPGPGPRRGRWPAAGSAGGRGGCRQ
jgi:hypothetical protein